MKINEYVISEYTWKPFDEEEGRVPNCVDCEHYPGDISIGGAGRPCRGCEAIFVCEGEPRGRLYFKRKEATKIGY